MRTRFIPSRDEIKVPRSAWWLTCCLVLLTQPLLAATGSDADKVSQAGFFEHPLVWTGGQAPSAVESQVLLGDVGIFQTNGVSAGLASLEKFLTMFPESAWSASLHVNLAEYYRNNGNYSPALAHWEAAWNETATNQDKSSQKVAAQTIAGWTRLLASLGEKDKLETLFKETDAFNLPLGAYATTIEETKSGLAMMEAQPGKSYRCGSFALGHMAMALGIDGKICHQLFEVDSPDGGFHMSDLLQLAATNGIAVAAVRRPSGGELVVPSVVHWKLNHYAAIVAKKGDLYRVEDPTFERHVWLDAKTIEAEASGEFIVPKDKVPAGWQELTAQESAAIYGKGYPNCLDDNNDWGPQDCDGSDGDDEDSACDPPAANDGASSGGGPPSPPPCPDCGMPQWSVSEPYITLWLKDAPLLYRQSTGKWMKLELSYKSRGDAQSSQISGFGDKWSCNWSGMLQSESTNADAIVDYRSGGGQESFATDGTLSYKTARKVISGLSSGSAFSIITPTASQNNYGFSFGNLTGTTNYLLTQRQDHYGRLLKQMNYQTSGSVTRMTSVLDIDGRTNTLTYGNSSYPNLITAVSDPYGRTAYFNYNSGGLLTNIVDAQGMSTYFQYDSSENITNMVTPYGTNSFEYFSGRSATSGGLQRALRITEANGQQQLYAYQDTMTDVSGDWYSMPYPYDGYSYYRLSFHWNRAQYATISSYGLTNLLCMAGNDYNNASVKHWLHGNPGATMETLSDTLDSTADPYDPVIGDRPNCFTYIYQGESAPYIDDIYNLTNPALQRVTDILLNNSNPYYEAVHISRNGIGNPTNTVYYNRNYRDGGETSSIAGYTNLFDSSGTYLLQEYGPRGELVRGYGYDPVITNLLVSVTNAVGDVLRYTHDTNTLKVTSIIFPGGLIRTNIYYTSGPDQGFLAQQIDIGFRTNSFAYTDGNLSTQTNELGLVTTQIYDNLNRLISTGYPDGTTVSNVYNKLDIVATKDRLNQWTYYNFNAVQQVLAVTNADDQVTAYDYCGCGSPDEIIRWNGATPLVTTYDHNMGGLVTNITYPDGYEVAYTYDNFDRVYTAIDSVANEIVKYYELHGLKSNLQEQWLGGQNILINQFDEYGRLTNSLDRNWIETVSSYDFLDRLTSRYAVSQEGGPQTGTETFSYDSLGETNYIDQLGHSTTYVRDLAGRVLYQTNANNEAQCFTYNPADQLLTLSDGKNQTTTWGYDTFGRVTNKVDAAGNRIFAYQYDPDDRLTNRWSAAKGYTTYKYDSIGNLTNVVYPVSSNIVLRYDSLNRLTNMVDGLGSTLFSWTDGSQLAGETGPWANDAVNYTYSGRQRSGVSLSQPNATTWVQNYNYDSLMRLSTITSPAGTFTYYSYFAEGNLPADIFLPVKGYPYPQITRQYDNLARLTEVTLNTPLAYQQFQYAYDAGSEVTQQVFTVGNFINYTYDNIGQLKTAQGFEPAIYDPISEDYINSPRQQEQFGYAYDQAWNLNQRTNNALVQNFGLNNLNELTNATRSGTLTVAGNASEKGSPAYDPYYYYPGVTNVTVSGTGLSSGLADVYQDGSWSRTNATPANGANTYTATAQDNIGRTAVNTVTANLPATGSYSYDLNGNLLTDGVRSFAYDDENELTSVWVTNAWRNDFVYDGMSRRRIERDYSWSGSVWTQTNEVHFIYDGKLVIQERDINNLPQVTYTRGSDSSGTLQGAGGIGGLLARTENPKLLIADPLASAYYFFDNNGNVMGLVNTNGLLVAQYTYDPFGNTLSMSGSLATVNKYRFSSKEWNDNAGLYYYGFRFYDPNLQRWINRDPIQEEGGINLYGFVGNNPINSIDFFGEYCPAMAYPVMTGESIITGAGLLAAAGMTAAAGVGTLDGIVALSIYNPNNWYETNPNGVNAPPLTVTAPYQMDSKRWDGDSPNKPKTDSRLPRRNRADGKRTNDPDDYPDPKPKPPEKPPEKPLPDHDIDADGNRSYPPSSCQ